MLGTGVLPNAPLRTLNELMGGQEDSQRISVRGVVRSAEVKTVWNRRILYLTLDSGFGEMAAHVLDFDGSFNNLVDAEVLLRGVCGTNFNGAGQLIGVRLFVPTLSDVVVDKHAPLEAFAAPLQQLDHLLRFGQTKVPNHRVRLLGTVTYQRLGKNLFIQSEGRALEVHTKQMTPVPVGTNIEVLGFTAPGSFTPVLEDAVFRTTGSARSSLQPRAIQAGQVIVQENGFKAAPYDGLLFSLRGELMERMETTHAQVFILRQGGTVFSARLDTDIANARLFDGLSPGTVVELSGICTIEADQTGDPGLFQILLRSAADVRIIQSSSWWNTRHVLWMLGLTTLVALLTLKAALSLRARVKQQGAEISETREHFQRILETANDPFIESDAQGRILEWNKRAEAVFGWTRTEVLGRPLSETVMPVGVRAAHQAGMARYLQTRQSRVMNRPVELTALARDGREFPVELTLWALETGGETKFNAFVRDISERKLAEEQLRRSEEFNRQILESSPDCIKVLDLSGQLLNINAGACKAMEIDSLDDLPSRFWPDLWATEDRALAQAAIERGCRGQETSFRGFCPTLAGTPKWWDVRVTAITKDGVPERLLAISRDITAQMIAENAAREAQQRLDLALRGAQIGIWTLDLETDCMTWEKGCPVLFGLPDQPMSFDVQFLDSLVHPEDIGIVKARRAVAASDGYLRSEYRVVWPDGSVHVISSRGDVTYANGKPVRVAGICWDITARKEAEQALAASEFRLREAQKIAHLGHWEFDLKTNEISWSDETFRIFGLPKDRPVSYERYLALLPLQDRQEILTAVTNTVVTGQPYQLTHRICLDDGTVKHVEARGRAEYDKDGKTFRLVGTVLDATSRVEAVLALRRSHDELEQRVDQRTAQLASSNAALQDSNDALLKSESRYRNLLEQSPLAVHIFDMKGQTVSVNPAFEKLFGVTAAEMTAYNVLQDSEVIANGTRELLDQVFAGEVLMTPAIQHRASFGASRTPLPWIEVTGYPVRDRRGTVQEIVLLVQNVSDRQSALQSLRRSEAEFRQLADSMPQIVWTAQPDGSLDYYNERWYAYSGFDRDRIGDQSWLPILHPEDVERSAAIWYSSVHSGADYEVEHRFWDRTTESYRWHLSRAVPMKNEIGEIVRWFGTCTDIHDQKTAKEELEVQVSSRTSELLSSLAEKTTLLKEVHHRVKNNLQVISSLLRMQWQTVQDPAARAALQDSRQRVLSMARIHERLYGNQQVDAIDFGEYTETLVNELFQSYGLQSHRVVGRVTVSSVLLSVDQAIPCGLILNELVTNSLKYAYPEGMSGEVRVAVREIASGHVSVIVEDDGVGLPDNFDWQGSKSLGLPIIDILSKQLGGTLTIQSQPGAQFKIEFPKSQGLEPKAA